MEAAPDFKTLLRRSRTALDLTQESLAEAVGCAAQTIRSFEIGRRRPSREMAARIAAVLQLAPDKRDLFVRLARTPLSASETLPDQAVEPLPARAAFDQPLRPPPPPPLIGRREELARLQQLFLADSRRLVTLLGPGGIGKTSLALCCAADLAEQFADGATVVLLAAVVDPAQLLPAIAAALGCSLAGVRNPEATLAECLRDREVLLVLDNLEQLLGVESQPLTLLNDLLAAAAGLRILVTSRERLRLRDEWLLPLDGLALPDERMPNAIDRSAAVLLFLERARQVDVGFAISARNRAAIARICRTLGGVPLAIELAAAWVRVLSCEEIADLVEHDAAALSASHQDALPRHASLRAVLDHSWQLLSAAEQTLFMRLSVFRGPCRREAIAAVMDDSAAVLPLLAGLVDASLVQRNQDLYGATHYQMHEFVRQYAESHLDAAALDAAAARHAAYYAGWLADQEARLKSPEQRATVDVINAEIANLRAAWRWACKHGDAHMVRRMLLTLDWFFEIRGWYDAAAATFTRAVDALQPLAAQPDASEEVQVCYWIALGRTGFHSMRRDPQLAARRLSDSVAALRRISRNGEQIQCLKGLAYVQIFAGNYAAAEELLDEGRVIAVARDDPWNLTIILVVRAVMETIRRPAAVARNYLLEALTLARQVGDPRPIAMLLTYLSLVALAGGEAEHAERLAAESHLMAGLNQDRFQISLALQALGRVAHARSEYREANWFLSESLEIAREIGDRWLEAQALGCKAALAAAQGDPAA
ncbi:MAG: helix-turn-helix domain-containing protein, partial [Oscillochloris sp.]|nr:helix-turn-helix domain-containing protein [Oscillochloris sp.]